MATVRKKNGSAWRQLGRFMSGWAGVVTTLAAGIGSAIAVAILWGSTILAIVATPQQTSDLARADSVVLQMISDDHVARDSLAASLRRSMDGLATFVNLFRCEQAGYKAQECPLIPRTDLLPPLPEGGMAARAISKIPDADTLGG